MVICPLFRMVQGDWNADGDENDNGCLEGDCGFYSIRSGRCAIASLGDLADVIITQKKGY